MIIFKVYDPNTITFGYWDEYGISYQEPLPADSQIIERPYTASQAMRELRARRNDLLYGCDWTQLPDTGLSTDKLLEWRDYRQELRDLPTKVATQGWNNVEWPTQPLDR
jgi:Phage tail assembly chaperone protein